jgi:hypothetical protein
MRSASVVAAVEYVRADGAFGRAVVASALQRADEPADALAYFTSRYGRALPQPLKRGVTDAVRRLYGERAALQYDGLSRAWRMADVIELTHAKPRDEAQSALFRWLLDRRHDRADAANPAPCCRCCALARSSRRCRRTSGVRWCRRLRLIRRSRRTG